MNIIKNTRLSLLGTCLTATCCLVACNGGNNSSNSSATPSNGNIVHTAVTAAKSKLLKSDFYLMRMGGGYDSVSHTATSGQTCLANASNQDNIYIGNPSASLTFDHQQQVATLQNALNVDVSSQLGGDRFSISVAAQFANSAKNNSYTTNIVYLYKYAGKAVFKDGSLGQGLNALTPYAAEIEQSSPTEFRNMCGNRFVEQMDAGAVLGVRLALNFNSHSDQERFATQLKADLGLANIATAIEQAASSSNIHVDMTLSAIQVGGQPEKLNDVFGQHDASGNYPFINCEAQNGGEGNKACNLMISSIIAYAQTMSTQLHDSNGNLILDRLYYTNPAVTEYTHLGIPVQGVADPSAEILSTMQELTSQYDKTVYDYNFVTHYLTILPTKLDSPTKESLKNAAERLGNQINSVFLLPVYRVTDCYKGYVSSQCLTIRNNIENALSSYALRDVQINLIKYLEDNSYSGSLLNYYGDSTPEPSDYKRSEQPCIFAPVSNPVDARYAVNCDGKWLTTDNSDGVILQPGLAGKGLLVKDLAYISTPPNSNDNGQMIIYTDTMLPVDNYYDNYFSADLIGIFAPGYTTGDASLGITKLYENQA